MPLSGYNRIAGGDLARLAALSDGLFSIAMTLLVLDLRTPEAADIHDSHELAVAVVAVWPRLLTVAMSFLTLGIFWTGQQTQLAQLERGNRELGWLHLGFLFFVSLVPFSTRLLAGFIDYRLALLVYWLNIFALGVSIYATWRYAVRTGLLKPGTPAATGLAIERRIIIAQCLYGFGALLCIWSMHLSIGCIFMLQLYYAIGPRLPARLLRG